MFRWAQVRSFGGTADFAMLVVHSHLGTDFSQDEFWIPVLQKMVQYHQTRPLTEAEISLIFCWICYHRFGQRIMREQAPPLPGRMATTAMQFTLVPAEGVQPDESFHPETLTVLHMWEKTCEWQRERLRGIPEELLNPGPRVSWAASGYSPLSWGEPIQFMMEELLNHASLLDEGTRMEHCVGQYVKMCSEGRSSIWSFRREYGQSLLTIEVNPASKRIAQVKGFRNAAPDPQWMMYVRQWAQLNGLAV